jgi:hypothetical protein
MDKQTLQGRASECSKRERMQERENERQTNAINRSERTKQKSQRSKREQQMHDAKCKQDQKTEWHLGTIFSPKTLSTPAT